MKRHIAALGVILLGGVTALIVNSKHGTASENDSINKRVVVITSEGCKPSKRTCYTEQKGDTIVTYKGSYRERTTTIVK
ncbi:MAG: hypothetical protein ACTTKZ_03900 [Bacteroides sp.]